MSIAICIPIHEKPTDKHRECINALEAEAKDGKRRILRIEAVGGSCIRVVRNDLSHQFLTSKCEWMMNIDSDVHGFTLKDIDLLINSGHKIISGPYFKRNEKKEWAFNTLAGGVNPGSPTAQEILYAAGGFLLIHRSIFERMIEQFPKIKYHSDNHKEAPLRHDFWRGGIHKKRLLTEDYGFCQLAIEMGEKIYAHFGVTLIHENPRTSEEQQIEQPAPPKAILSQPPASTFILPDNHVSNLDIFLDRVTLTGKTEAIAFAEIIQYFRKTRRKLPPDFPLPKI